jgi:predicted DsbA family dithiol-disulfide isomerase
VLARIAAECGDDEAAALAYLQSDEDAAAVRAHVERAQQMGITGVPFFILAGRYGVGGAQSPELMLEALRRSLAAP